MAAPPDTVRATVGVEVVRDSVDAALQEAGRAALAVTRALREHGVDDRDLQTEQVSVYPRYANLPGPDTGPPPVAGYVVSNAVRVTVRDVDRAGALLAAAAAAAGDAARINGVGFALDDDTAALAVAREAAFADARAKAQHYADLAGRPLGALVAVSEVGADQAGPVVHHAMAMEAGPVPIAPGEQEVAVTVVATWALD